MKIPNKSYWAAPLLIALVSLGILLPKPYKSGSQASMPNASHSGTRQIASQPDEPKTLAGAAHVRLFIEGLPFKEPPSTQKLMNNVKGILLTKDQRTILEASIHKRRATDDDIYNQPGCFIPHHFFRFYDNEGVVFATLAVCYCCGGARLGGSAAAEIMGDADFIDFDYVAVKKMLLAMNVPTNIDCHQNARY